MLKIQTIYSQIIKNMSIKKKSDAVLRSEKRYNNVKAIYLKHKGKLSNGQIYVDYVSKIASQRILNQVIKDLQNESHAQSIEQDLEVA